ncbi:MAG: AAA family ATPase, partial [Clostridium sp.]
MIYIKNINLGTSDFKKIIDSNSYFIDKTLIVKEFLEDTVEIVLVPRPRRFGKTLNMSILYHFLSISTEDNSYLFKGLKIEKENEIMKNQGTYPVIYLSFKDEKHYAFNEFIESMKKQISSMYKRFYYVYSSLSFENDKVYFDNIINQVCSNQDLEISLFKLSGYLNTYYNQKVVILIDEYDTPIHAGHFENYYNEIIGFMRKFLSSALKDN